MLLRLLHAEDAGNFKERECFGEVLTSVAELCESGGVIFSVDKPGTYSTTEDKRLLIKERKSVFFFL